MYDFDKILLESLAYYTNGLRHNAKFDKETALKLIKRSREQKVFPIVFLTNSEAFEKVLDKAELARIKSEVLLSVSSQVQRSAELVRVYNLLKADGISSVVFKGAVCRMLYSNPEYRISSDEDILVGADNLERSADVLSANGYVVLEKKNGEIKLMSRRIGSLVELHSSLVNADVSGAFGRIAETFNEQLQNPEMLDIGSGEIAVFSPTYGFLSLCIHFFNHFIRGGIGIRPVMDIAQYIKIYQDRIDFDYCFDLLRDINAEMLILTVISLCRKYFGIECGFEGSVNTVEALLDDIMNAGIYGTADESRVHGGTATRAAAREGKGMLSSAVSAVFPSKEEIVSQHPELKGKIGEINRYRIKRIVGFAAKKGKLNVLQSAGKRNRLFKELGILK